MISAMRGQSGRQAPATIHAIRNWSRLRFFSILSPENAHLAPDLKIELWVEFHVLPKSDIWLEKLLFPLRP
jgi:hypothetical protein